MKEKKNQTNQQKKTDGENNPLPDIDPRDNPEINKDNPENSEEKKEKKDKDKNDKDKDKRDKDRDRNKDKDKKDKDKKERGKGNAIIQRSIKHILHHDDKRKDKKLQKESQNTKSDHGEDDTVNSTLETMSDSSQKLVIPADPGAVSDTEEDEDKRYNERSDGVHSESDHINSIEENSADTLSYSERYSDGDRREDFQDSEDRSNLELDGKDTISDIEEEEANLLALYKDVCHSDCARKKYRFYNYNLFYRLACVWLQNQ